MQVSRDCSCLDGTAWGSPAWGLGALGLALGAVKAPWIWTACCYGALEYMASLSRVFGFRDLGFKDYKGFYALNLYYH